ncbi:COX assembly mitochondrial protein [Meloidogyne graminicola]|uniref:COX assembly mitochondrial protein n=1 Tax=Meloidogyne graminicola TaxID=189291 RepID=A0A8T0A0A3_9BILA|nr:COX assembly mitochondrial protein [Meloidogyne graminicola]
MHQQDKSYYESRDPFVVNTLNDSHNSLRERKEGELVYDERRKKWYRVKKTMYPTHVTTGPLNLGDPEDRQAIFCIETHIFRFLRKYEENVIIPDIIAKRIEKQECRETFMKFVECMRVDGALTGTHNCRPFYKEFQNCKVKKFRDPELRKEITEEFIKERSEFRKTGLDKNYREFDRYLKWKENKLLKEKQDKT